MVTLQKKIRYAGNAANAPVTAIEAQFQVPVHEYFVADTAESFETVGSVQKRIISREVVSIETTISAKDYRVEFGTELIAGRNPKLFGKFVSDSLASRSIDNFLVSIDVVYLANGQFPVGKESLELVFFPKFDLDAPQLIRLVEVSGSLILISKEAFSILAKRLTATAGRFDPIALLPVISMLADTTAAHPELIQRLSADDTERLNGVLLAAGVADPTGLIDLIKKDFGTLFDIPLTIPEMKSVKIAGTLTIETSDATPVTKDDFLAYDLSAEYLIRETGQLQILHHQLGVIQDNAAPFSFGGGRPILRESIAGNVTVQVKGSAVPPIVFEDPYDGMEKIDIKVSLRRGNRVAPSDNPNVPAVPKKLRGQVLSFDDQCALKCLTVIVQARTAAGGPWGTVGAAKTDSGGNFSMPYPYGVFTAARASVLRTPDDPIEVRVTAVRPGDQTIADDFLYLLVHNPERPTDKSKDDCECDSSTKAPRLPDYADLIGSDQYTQDIGGACVNLSTPNRTLSEFNYQAIVRTSDPEVSNYTLRRVDPPIENVAVVLNRLVASNNATNSLLNVLNGMNGQLNAVLNPMDAAAYARANSVLASLNAMMHPLNAALAPLPAAPIPSLSASLGALTAAANASDLFNVALNLAAPPMQIAIDAANALANAALTAALVSAQPAMPGLFDFLTQSQNGAANALFNPLNPALALANNNALTANLKDALKNALGGANGVLSAALQPSQNALSAALGAADAVESADAATRYELVGGTQKIGRRAIDLDNPVAWNDAPEAASAGTSTTGNYRQAQSAILMRQPFGSPAPADVKKGLSFYQAVTVATGHILHYKSLFKADGYSLGDLVYSLPLAPGQKKQIVVIEASHTLQGAESQRLSQGESLSANIANERDILTQLSGTVSETMRGSSTANTSGISAGLGTGGQGSGSAGTGQGGGGGYGGSGSLVIGVAGGTANSNSIASQDSSRDVSEFFADKLRQSIMQNADSYRQLNASVVTTVTEGQRYGVTSEVVANHNHCHALTMMYFEVLRHYAIFQELSSVEECVFVPLLMTNFTTQNIYKWRDVLARFLLPMPSDTYLQTLPYAVGAPRPHPLLRAFDANERIKTKYANVDFPEGAYDDEQIQFLRGSMRLTVNLTRPRTRFDRILSFPLTKQLDTKALAGDTLKYSQDMVAYSAKVAATGGIYALFEGPKAPPNPAQYEVTAREAIFDAFMSLDANYQSAAPADCIRIKNFQPPALIAVGATLDPLKVLFTQPIDFFADNKDDRDQWKAYADILGYQDVLKLLSAYFAGNLISEWDTIFYNDIVPLVFEKIISSIGISELSIDLASESRYKGGERQIRLNLTGTTSRKRNQMPLQLRLDVSNSKVKALQEFVKLDIEDLTITYSTSHYNGVLYSGSINDDLLDGTNLYIPENNEEKRNPRKEDAYLQCKLIEHLNSHLEHYNKALWFNLDPDRRYMLVDGFGIQTYNSDGLPIDENGDPIPLRSLASVVKNELVTITGNSMVFPVAAGYRVSKDYLLERVVDDDGAETTRRVTLLDHYQPITPIQPYRISVPTRGVFVEAVQGACNACEKIETERLQDWNKFPNTDEPTAIAPITPPTPAVTDWRAAFRDFAPPLVNIQNAPAAPAPGDGMAGLTDLLGRSGQFRDVTGLEGNQANVMRTYLSNQENAKSFAEMAKEMAMQNHNTQNSGKIMDTLKAAKTDGALDQGDYSRLVKDHLQQQIDGGVTKKAEIDRSRQTSTTPLTKALVDAAGQGRSVSGRTIDDEGGSEAVTIGGGNDQQSLDTTLAEATGVPSVYQPNGRTCWAAVSSMMCMWRDPVRYQSIDDVMTDAGDKFVQLYNGGRGAGKGLPMSDKQEFLTGLEMVSEPTGVNYPLQSYIDWVETYGPLWITIDAEPEPDEFSQHAIIVIRLSGSGTPDGQGTYVTYIDPMGGKTVTVPFTEFVASYEALASYKKETPPSIQVVHFKDVAVDEGEGGGGAAVAGAVGEKVLDKAFDVGGSYIEAQMAAGSGTTELPNNMTFMLAGTKPEDYKTDGPMQNSIRQCRITFDDLVSTGLGDGLDGTITLQWFSTRYRGPISSRMKVGTAKQLQSIQFAKAITGTGTLFVGAALSSADVKVSPFSVAVEDKEAPPYQILMLRIDIVAKAKTATGDSLTTSAIVALHPDKPVNYKLVYVRTPRRALKAEVDTTP